MNEDEVTSHLVKALRECGPEATRRFLRDVAGVTSSRDQFWYWDKPKHTWVPPDEPARGIVLGLASRFNVSADDGRGGEWGESRLDAAIWDVDTLVLIETKIRSGSLGSNQLVGHAIRGALVVPGENQVWTSESIPAGFVAATWDHVGGWLGREMSAADDHLDPDAASRLAAVLRGEDVCSSDPSLPPIGESAVTLPRTQEPPQWPVSKIRGEWDFTRVRRICLDLYGSELIGENDCTEDTTRLRGAYRTAGEPLPPGLQGDRRGGAMTPERVLSVLYGNMGPAGTTLLHNAYPKGWTAMRARTVESGADRHVLVAMLAWAGRTDAKAGSKRIFEHVPRLWAKAPLRSPGLERLHSALAPARSQN